MATSSMYTAVSGLNALETELAVISNNLTNQNTYGYKENRTIFGDVLTQSMGGQGSGGGVTVLGVDPVFSQGTLDTTGNTLDMAIDGDGFFKLSGAGGQFYTRDGQFTTDSSGNIVDQKGYFLQGYQVDAGNHLTDSIGDLNLTTAQIPGEATTTVGMDVNLNSADTVQTSAFSITNNIASNYNYSTTVDVYDSQGGSWPVNAYFCNEGNNTWDVYYAYTPTGGSLTQINATATTLTFSSTGAFVSAANANITFQPISTVNSETIAFNYDQTSDPSTQYNSDFAVLSVSKDGYATGTLSNFSIDKTGIITATFTNGQTKTVGEVALAKFPAESQLASVGGNMYQETNGSGQAVVGKPGTASLGNVLSGSLEESNVSQSDQFVKMIAAQSAYEANSKMISTEEQLLQTLISMKQ